MYGRISENLKMHLGTDIIARTQTTGKSWITLYYLAQKAGILQTADLSCHWVKGPNVTRDYEVHFLYKAM
jgi:hypothetical protein